MEGFNAKVLIRRNSDGRVVEYTGDACKDTSVYQWTEGNYGCDCNRHIFFELSYDDNPDSDEEVEIEEIPCGETRYSIQMYDIATGELMWDEFVIRKPYC